MIEILFVAGLARNQTIGVYAASALSRTGDWEPTVIAELLRECHPAELLQLCQECHMTEVTLVLATSLVVYLFLLTFI